jgi:repressor LexA
MPEPLTTLERRILEYVIDYLRENTYQPSIREIGRRFQIKSTKTVSEYLQSLAEKGWIERDPSRSRGVRVLGLDLSADTISVPCYEAPPAPAAPAEGAPVQELGFDRRLIGSAGAWFMTMRGRTMEDSGIHDGDLLLVEPVADGALEEGDVVVTTEGGEATVTRHFAGEPRAVAGRVTAIFRRLYVPVAAREPVPAGS